MHIFCRAARFAMQPFARLLICGPSLRLWRRELIAAMLFVESSLFERARKEYLADDGLRELQAVLLAKPDAGVLIPGTGGVRKLRWKAEGRGSEADCGSSTTSTPRRFAAICCTSMRRT